jgi:PadR family transcriptional regulator, regulatory protein PadR
MDHHDLLSGFVRLHVLHHASEGEIYGQWMIEGYLASREDQGGPGGRRRRLYAATEFGHEALAVARERLRELVGEVGKAP